MYFVQEQIPNEWIWLLLYAALNWFCLFDRIPRWSEKLVVESACLSVSHGFWGCGHDRRRLTSTGTSGMVAGRGSLPLSKAVSRWVSQLAPGVWNPVVTQGRVLGFHVRRQHQLPLGGDKKTTQWVSSNTAKPTLVCFQFTFNPRSSCWSDTRISRMRIFILSHSWKQTRTYGLLFEVFCIISAMLNSSGSLSKMSSKTFLT